MKFCQCQKIWRTILQSDISYDEDQTVSVFQDKLWAEIMLDNALILRSQNSSDMMPSLYKPGVTKRIPGEPVSLQSLAQPYNTPEADNQGLAWYTRSFHAGVLR